MNLFTEHYAQSLTHLPGEGRHIIAQTEGDQIVVYQAYKHSIADWAVKNQQLGGPEFSYNRMSWIKPNFLWMMYRCGWCAKENQERVLGLWMRKSDFEAILLGAVSSTYVQEQHGAQEVWKRALAVSDVRLQWDPDHNPYGNPLARKAVQLGLRGQVLKNFGESQITRIHDLTPFILEQRKWVEARQLDQLVVPVERVYSFVNEKARVAVGADR
jgi:hypothetical protein